MAEPAGAQAVAPPPDAKGDACRATVASGRPCRCRATPGSDVCAVHRRQREQRDEAQRDECAICLCPIAVRRGARGAMECGHAFHAKCLRAWFARRQLTCPVCRSTCLEGMALLGGRRLAPKLQALLRTVPPPPRAFFPSYIVSHLESPKVQAALGVDEAMAGLLIDLACESFTEAFFFAKMRALEL